MTGISRRTKLLYGSGFAAQGIKDALFQLFLFFYFSQVLGLDAALAGAATIIALLFDAISDPLVGAWSDKWKSKSWGRRHPFMLVSALPLGLFIYLLFLPPNGLDQTGLFLWLTGFTILVRLALTFFIVPAMSLGAELSSDYEERTSIASYRITFGALVGPAVIIFGLTTFFIPKEGMSNGLFNEAAYPKFALLCGVLAIIAIIISTLGTKGTIPTLQTISKDQERLSVWKLISGVLDALKMKSYWSLLSYTMVIYIAIGVGTVFMTYFTTFFFELSEKELAVLPVGSALGGIFALLLGPVLGKKLDKKNTVILSTVLFAFFFSMPFNLRFLNLFPNNGHPLLLLLYFITVMLAYTFLWIALSLTNSMMADVVDEFELKSDKRQEGLFFASLSFAYKCTVGIGYLVAGLLLNWISFPKQVELSEVPIEAINGLGIIGGPILMCIYISAIFFIMVYPINKNKYDEIREALELKNSR